MKDSNRKVGSTMSHENTINGAVKFKKDKTVKTFRKTFGLLVYSTLEFQLSSLIMWKSRKGKHLGKKVKYI